MRNGIQRVCVELRVHTRIRKNNLTFERRLCKKTKIGKGWIRCTLVRGQPMWPIHSVDVATIQYPMELETNP